MNRILSQMASVNYVVTELTKLNVIRLYLIRSFRGRAQACGKPSRGQRTWSNAWTAYLYNKDLRIYLAEVQRQLNKDRKVEKIDYKKVKKKLKKSAKDDQPKQLKKKRDLWF